MGAPAITYFCENGHIVLDVPHHYIAGEPERCKYCHSEKIKIQLEWQDADYGPHRVPYGPITHEVHTVTLHIPVYDVSKLFEEQGEFGLLHNY